MGTLNQIALAIIPSVGVGFLFYKVIKTIVESDRKERLAYAQWQAEEARREGDASAATQERSE